MSHNRNQRTGGKSRGFLGNRKARLGVVTVLAAALTMGLSACGGTTPAGTSSSKLDQLKSSGVRIGVADALPTAGSDTTPTGLVPELTAMVFKKLGVEKAEAISMDFGALIPSLQSKRIDVAAGGFYVTAERCKAITLAEPSYYYQDGMAVKKGNPHGIKTYADVAKAGIEMGAVTGGATTQSAKAEGVAAEKIHEYADIPTMLDALKGGRIEAAPYDNVSIAYELKKPGNSDLSATEPTSPIVNGTPRPYSVSVGFAKDATDIAEAFNKTQAEMFEAGEFDALIAKWGQSKEDLRPGNAPNIDSLCSEK